MTARKSSSSLRIGKFLITYNISMLYMYILGLAVAPNIRVQRTIEKGFHLNLIEKMIEKIYSLFSKPI